MARTIASRADPPAGDTSSSSSPPQRGRSHRRHARRAHRTPFRARPCSSPTTARPTPPPRSRVRPARRVVRSERVIGKGGAARRPPQRPSALARTRAVTGEAIFVLCDGDLGESAARLGRARGGGPRAARPTWRWRRSSRRIGGGLGVAVGVRALGDPPPLRPCTRGRPSPASAHFEGARWKTCCRSQTGSAWRSG